MRDNNSLEVYTSLYVRLLHDIAGCYVDSDAAGDELKIRHRVATEGISFLTKTLRSVGKAFDKALQGEVPFVWPGLKTQAGVPILYGWLHKRIFDSNGYIRSDADIRSISHARQLFSFLEKLELPNKPEAVKTVLDTFVSVQCELEKLVIDGTDPVIKRARALVARVLRGTNPRNIIPGHGTGSVATGEKGCEKTHFSRLYKSLDVYYSFCEYFHVNASQTCDQLNMIRSLRVLEHSTAKVVFVPKDSRGPRLISEEPLELQWIQQGQQRMLYDIIEGSPLTSGFVNFTNQEINRSLALEASRTQKYVTLDMKDASDRVSLKLVRELFSGTQWLEALIASRSGYTQLPDGRVIRMESFAPMGSAVCFPVEALTFWSLAVSMLVVYRNLKWRDAIKRVYVYGDDLILHSKDYACVLQHFPTLGLKFNVAKCCVLGFFRESCGCDAYKGVDVTPLRLRKEWSRRASSDAAQLASYVELSNSMHEVGYHGTAQYVQDMVESLYGKLPYVEYREKRKDGSYSIFTPPGRVIGWFRPEVSPNSLIATQQVRRRWNAKLHRAEVFGYSIKPAWSKPGNEDGWELLLRTLCRQAVKPANNVNVLKNTAPQEKGLRRGIYPVAHRSRLTRTWGCRI